MEMTIHERIEKLLKYRTFWHISFWIMFIIIEILGAYQPVFEFPYIYFFIIRELSFIVFGYTLILFLFPALIYRRKYFYYVIIGLALVVIQSKFQLVVYKYFKLNGYEYFNMGYSLPNVFLFFVLITFLKLGKDYYFKQQQMAEEKQRRTELELEFLKSQISPHFLFNTMNNLYGLSVIKSDLLPPLMLQLSDLLRYSLYETNQPFVPLEKEINYIKNYIDLEKIRIGDRLKLTINIENENYNNIYIAPIILIIFVENAFKHSRAVVDNKINISFDLYLKNDWIVFVVKNNFIELEKDKHSGIGLENVRKRLEFLYQNEYVLDTNISNDIYTTTIKLKRK